MPKKEQAKTAIKTIAQKLHEYKASQLKARQSLAGEMAETMLKIAEPILDAPRDPMDMSAGRETKHNMAFRYMFRWPTAGAIDNLAYKKDYMDRTQATVHKREEEYGGDSNGWDVTGWETVAALQASDQWTAAKLIADAYCELWERVTGETFDIEEHRKEVEDNKRNKTRKLTASQERAQKILG